jgi:hypothetical protein
MTYYMNNSLKQLENSELINKLIAFGYKDLVDAFLENENEVYTKKGRLNKSGACRVLNYKPKDLEDAIKECQILLQKEFGIEEEEEKD